MNIHEMLIEKIADFENCTGIKPRTIYLGQFEMEQILAWAKETFALQETPKAIDGPELMGLRLLEVKTDSHIGIR